MQLVNIGFGNIVSGERIISIISPESAPIKRMIQDARDSKTAIDATYGRRTRSVIIMDSGHIILSAVQPETIANRADVSQDESEEETAEEDPSIQAFATMPVITNATVVEQMVADYEKLSVTVTPTFILTGVDVAEDFANEVKEKGLADYYKVTDNTSTVKGETLADTIRVVSSYVDVIAMRSPKKAWNIPPPL